ncbi:hypothetical protein FB45DRAFT_1096783 [Roridomyces roridus]|uniref:Protein kinase domain-containing protein n=1 Tax=Roridomyces roridus TaxID=1738132 RepID=A0AAD7BE55_9AGAR|nr:hypothetical protein FB45DRAFT_1096783 [Roridomyces roridus]
MTFSRPRHPAVRATEYSINSDMAASLTFGTARTSVEHNRKTLEVEINNFLASRSKEEPGFHNVALCLETFQVNGPNGIHDVIATEPALRMSSVLYTSAMDSLDDRVVFRQTLAGLGFIHKHGFVHRDLHVGNIAIEFPFLRTAGVAAIMQSTGHPVCHALLPMAPTSNPPPLPTYVVESAKFCQHFTLTNADTQSFVVKIIDFGCSFRSATDEPPNPYHHGPPKPPECNLLEMIPGRRLPSTPEDVPENSSNNHPWSELLERERGRLALESRDVSDLNWSAQGDVWVIGCTLLSILVRNETQCIFLFGARLWDRDSLRTSPNTSAQCQSGTGYC